MGSPGVIILGPEASRVTSAGPVSVEVSVSWLVFSEQIGVLDKDAAGVRVWDWVDGFKITPWAVARAPGRWARRARFCTWRCAKRKQRWSLLCHSCSYHAPLFMAPLTFTKIQSRNPFERRLLLEVCSILSSTNIAVLLHARVHSNFVPGKVCTWEEVGKEEQEVTAGRSDWTAATVAAGVRMS